MYAESRKIHKDDLRNKIIDFCLNRNHYAAFTNWAKEKADAVEVLLKHGANANETDTFGSAAIYAAKYQSLKTLKLLVQYGADINYMSVFKENPLYVAIHGRDFEMVKFLVENGADIHAINEWGKTALSYAHQEDLRLFLIEHGAK